MSIVLGPDQALWFAAGNNIGRITTRGSLKAYTIPLNSFEVTGLTVGPDNGIWFAGFASDGKTRAIGRIVGGDQVRIVFRPRSIPWAITRGSDNALWFSLDYPPAIGRLTLKGLFRSFAVGSGPQGVTAARDGNIWFTEHRANRVGWIGRSGKVTELDIPRGDIEPTAITQGPGGVWFAGRSRLGRVTNDGAINIFWPKSPNSQPTSIAVGPDGAIWFTEYNLNAIGRIRLKKLP